MLPLGIYIGANKEAQISIQQSNSAPSDISLSNASIIENNAINDAIGNLSTLDADAGDVFTYSLAAGSGDMDNASFILDGSTLRAAEVFNHTTKDEYHLRIRSTDKAGLFVEKEFSVTILEAPSGFITEWSFPSSNSVFSLPLNLGNSSAFNCTVHWGDGSSSVITSADDPANSHTYVLAGTYQIEIVGVCEGFSCRGTAYAAQLTRVINWGTADRFSGFKYLYGGFGECTYLTSIPDKPIPASGAGCLTFQFAFYLCVRLTAIPENLFMHHTAVAENAFNTTFYNNYQVYNIPAGLFRYNTLASASAFQGTFYGCNKITSIPADLFKYNTLVSSYGFQNTFNNCSALVSIPADLFRHNTLVSTFGFNSTFRQCTALENVPEGLFRYNTAVSLLGFAQTFDGCLKLRLNKYIFFAPGEEATRFLNVVSNFSSCFRRVSFSGVQGEAPELWLCNFGTAAVTKSTCFGGAGNSLSSLSNYASIPAAWL